ncbi:MAG: UvrD-helicase domain-containing protein, partial [Clostridia bacterium]|nr:UvrD-helicase domain-containing protein [Clostridia bacterium]
MDIVEIRKKVIEKEFCNMNDRQFEAVTTVNGPLLVLAGAGSGKTTVLVNRIANLIKYGNAYQSNEDFAYKTQDIESARDFLEGRSETFFSPCFSVDAPKPREILAITFTNKAADELKNRINAKLGEGAEGIWAGTFHSICGKILRSNAEQIGYTPHFTIYDTDDQKRVIKDIIKQNNLDEKMYPVKAVLTTISHCKDALVTVEEFAKTNESDLRLKKIAEIYKEYQR